MLAKKTTVGEGGKTPSWRRTPEPLETWLPKQQAGTPPPDWKAVRESGYQAVVEYSFRLYEIAWIYRQEDSRFYEGMRWEVVKHGVISNLSKDDYLSTVKALKQSLNQEGRYIQLYALGGTLDRYAWGIMYPKGTASHTYRIYSEACAVDARVNARNVLLGLQECVTYE